MTTKNSTILKLFSSVLSGKSDGVSEFIPEFGVCLSGDSVYAVSEITSYLSDLKLSGNDLNKTFYKSWSIIKELSYEDILIEKMMHYMSTYGTDRKGEVYLPVSTLNVPDFKVKMVIINALSKNEVINKCLDLLISGIALAEGTLLELFSLLEDLDYEFTGNEGVRNKEANILIADKYNIYPESPEEFLRYVLFKTTGSTSLVKSEHVITSIKVSCKDISDMLTLFGEEKLAQIFNRFKPLFLAFKMSNNGNKKVVNRISRLSKKLHKPMVVNPLNRASVTKLADTDIHWLDNATIYSLFKALSACYNRMSGQDTFTYRIRNGKSWFNTKKVDVAVVEFNYLYILNYLKTRINGKGKAVFMPKNIEYALPTSEKMFIGNIPMGTKFYGDSLAVGIYWENSWGAYDLDLSGLNIGGKVGWDSYYQDEAEGLSYSGDLTDAVNGAVEFLHTENGYKITPTLVLNNVFEGSDDSEYKIVIGDDVEVDREYMMNPNKIVAEIKTSSVQRNTILGMIMSEDKELKSFTLLNFGAGVARVSGHGEITDLATKALFQQWKNPLTLKKVLLELGFDIYHNIVDEKQQLKIDFNLEIDRITKTTFIELFK